MTARIIEFPAERRPPPPPDPYYGLKLRDLVRIDGGSQVGVVHAFYDIQTPFPTVFLIIRGTGVNRCIHPKRLTPIDDSNPEDAA